MSEVPSSDTGGVKAFSIGGRLVRERERLHGMTDQERAWRAQYIKDQILSPSEPRYVPEYWEQRMNPIRKFYRYPLDRVGKALEPIVGKPKAEWFRYTIGKVAILVSLFYAGRYYMKYNSSDWTRRGGWKVMASRSAAYPGDPKFLKSKEKAKPQDFGDRGFKQSPI